MLCRATLVGLTLVVVLSRGAAIAAPAYDKVVIVVEENKALGDVLGSSEAPYLNSLAVSGATFGNMFGLTHPSQPNYLELFSGSNQGVNHNGLIAGVPLSTPNLAAAIAQAGGTFVGYSESMPSAGYTGEIADGGRYARRHNPWVNWQSNTPGPNQFLQAVNQPFSAFPTSFALLPRVSIVVPNNDNNSHDGTVGQMDTWLQQNLGAYATWAAANNSLLVVTFDEDSFASRNRIPTLFYGAGIAAGRTVPSTWTAHNLLRTVAEIAGATPPGAAAEVRTIVGPFAGDALVRTVSFRQGANGYAGATDAMLDSAQPTSAAATVSPLRSALAPQSQALVKFDGIFGNGGSLVPPGADIVSAKLLLHTTTATFNIQSTMLLHTMLAPWSDGDTWSSLGAGVGVDGVEAAAAAEFTVFPNIPDDYAIFDVSDSVQAWADGAANRGWVVNAAGVDAWQFDSSESLFLVDRPLLEVTYRAGRWLPISIMTTTWTPRTWWSGRWRWATPAAATRMATA